VDGVWQTTLRQGNGFGHVALLMEKPRNATVKAKTKLELYTLDRQRFEAASDKSDEFLKQVIKHFQLLEITPTEFANRVGEGRGNPPASN